MDMDQGLQIDSSLHVLMKKFTNQYILATGEMLVIKSSISSRPNWDLDLFKQTKNAGD